MIGPDTPCKWEPGDLIERRGQWPGVVFRVVSTRVFDWTVRVEVAYLEEGAVLPNDRLGYHYNIPEAVFDDPSNGMLTLALSARGD